MRLSRVLQLGILLVASSLTWGGLGAPLSQEIATLVERLADRSSAPWGQVMDWGSFDRARYLAGRLAELGYQVRLARSGEMWWAVVCLDVDEGEKVIPVIPGPLPSASHGFGGALGYIPGAGDFTDPRLDPAYFGWDELLPLPEDVPPVARARALETSIQPGERVHLLGAASVDPDGVLVIFRWDFGDGTYSCDMNPIHVFDRPGKYVITLQVIDNAGRSDVDRVRVSVFFEEDAGDEPSCGCGG